MNEGGGGVITQVAVGDFHAVAITSKGAIYTWAFGSETGNVKTDAGFPKRVNELSSMIVVSIAAGDRRTGCITEGGIMYTWGQGEDGVLGHGDENNCKSPKLVNAMVGKRPRQISFGYSHTAVCTEDGGLFTFGHGEHGQLGHGDMENNLLPKQVVALEGAFISQVACGLHFTMALTSGGHVYTWGNGEDGVLGHGSETSSMSPVPVEFLDEKKVTQISCCNRHSFAIVSSYEKKQVGAYYNDHESSMFNWNSYHRSRYDFYS